MGFFYCPTYNGELALFESDVRLIFIDLFMILEAE